MAIYDGVVTLADDQIPVIIELDDDHVRLSASGTEIGQWRADECRIDPVDDMTYTITAEDETLEFVPSQPGLFAAALNGASEEPIDTPVQHAQPAPEPVSSASAAEAPPPKPLTMGLFYALCVVTAVLAIWSLITIIF
ncbi:MAG: hypothetical protein ACLFRT_00250 [Actinomycetota bacterium]